MCTNMYILKHRPGLDERQGGYMIYATMECMGHTTSHPTHTRFPRRSVFNLQTPSFPKGVLVPQAELGVFFFRGPHEEL